MAGVIAPDGRSLPPLLDPALLAPARMLAWLRFDEEVFDGAQAGRPTVRVQGRLRRESSAAGSSLRYHIEFDAEHATMLRLAVRSGDRCVSLTEVTEIAYDCDLSAELLTPPGFGEREETLMRKGAYEDV